MSSSILRASRRTSLKPLKSPKPILKRKSLALSPLLLALPFSSSRTINTPSSAFPRSPKSPHVHFPPTPSISSTFVTHSSAAYDRAPIDVAPNPLELPPRGDRTYNVSFADSLSHGIVPVDIPHTEFDPPILDSDLPSPSAVDPKSPPPVFHRFVRFAALPPHTPLPSPHSQLGSEQNTTLSSGSPYPRSPYPAGPSPPLTPSEDQESIPLTSNTQVKKKPHRVVAWKGHGELKLADLFAAPSVSSPLRQTHFASNVHSSQPVRITSPEVMSPSPSNSHSTRPPPLNLSPGSASGSDCSNPSSQLSRAFWRSVSLVDLHDEEAAASAWAYPPSAAEFQEFLSEQDDPEDKYLTVPRLSLLSPVPLSAAPLSAVPELVMGRKPEMLWSPGLPRKKHSVDVPESVSSDSDDEYKEYPYANHKFVKSSNRSLDGAMLDLMSILSPGAQHEVEFCLNPPPRSTVAAPSPNDPFAAFPTFSAVLHLHGVAGRGIGQQGLEEVKGDGQAGQDVNGDLD